SKAIAMNTLFWIFWINNFLSVKTQDRNFRIKLDEFSVRYKDSGLIEHVDFRISKLDNRSYVNGEMKLYGDVPDIDMRTTMDFWKVNNSKKFKLYNVRLDACRFLKTFHRNSLFNIYVKSFKKHTNADLICPLKKNFSYTLTNWHMDEKDLPPFIPYGSFRTVSEYFSLSRLGVRIVTQGKVYPFPTK
ncbi:hypothetical protein KR009_002938, partial [Drosophila setifemur]